MHVCIYLSTEYRILYAYLSILLSITIPAFNVEEQDVDHSTRGC